MGTGANTEQRTGKRSVVGSIVGAVLLVGLVALTLELGAMLFAGSHPGAQALARSTDAPIVTPPSRSLARLPAVG